MGHGICFAGSEGSCGDRDKAEITILPVPYDRTSTWIKGADKGPLALLEASAALEFYDMETDSEVYRRGIYTCPFLEVDVPPEEMALRVEEKITELLDEGKFVVTIGGEHSVSVGPVRAHNKKHKDLCVLQLDAHSDLRDEYENSRYNHACAMARVKETCPVVHVGVRSMDVSEKKRLDPGSVFPARDIFGKKDWVDSVVGRLSPDVYVTIDLDVFDSSLMPSTGTPEPGGLTWYQVLRLLRTVTEARNVVGFDVVELCPSEHNKAPDFTAAKLVYKFLSYVYNK